MGRLLSLVLLAVLTSGCAPGVPPECAPLARLPTPVAGEQLVQLQEIADDVARETGTSDWEVTMLGVDESRGTVIVGTTKPSVEMCRTIHERYGPLVEVIYQEPIELFG